MTHAEYDAIVRETRADDWARAGNVLDELREIHDGDWPMLNAIELIEKRFEALFVTPDDEDDV